MKAVPLLIDSTQSSSMSRTFPVFSNDLQRELLLIESVNSTAAIATADAASKTFKTWKHLPWTIRRDILFPIADII
jgi:acyl-CoA reductase-like NAD-dependent aldehyde dehydrogenase